MSSANRFDGIAITGIGVATPIGIARDTVVAHVRDRKSGIGPLTRLAIPDAFAAETEDFDLKPLLKKPKNEKFMSQAVRLATLAARDALVHSGLDVASMDADRIGIYTGSGNTGICYDEFLPALSVAWGEGEERDFGKLGGRAARMIDAYFSVRTLSNSGIGLLAAEHGLHGSGANFVQSDSASALALDAAAMDLMEGRCDAVLAGGYDNLVVKSGFLGYSEADLLSPGGRLAPFAQGRDGIALGEAAAFFILERVDDTRARGAEPLATIELAMTSAEITVHDGLEDALPKLAEKLTRELAEAPDVVIARGMGLLQPDAVEASILKELQRQGSAVSSFKALTGYVGAATAAVELALALLCARAGFAAAGAPVGEPDPNLDFTPTREPTPLSPSDDLGLLALSGGMTGGASAVLLRLGAQ